MVADCASSTATSVAKNLAPSSHRASPPALNVLCDVASSVHRSRDRGPSNSPTTAHTFSLSSGSSSTRSSRSSISSSSIPSISLTSIKPPSPSPGAPDSHTRSPFTGKSSNSPHHHAGHDVTADATIPMSFSDMKRMSRSPTTGTGTAVAPPPSAAASGSSNAMAPPPPMSIRPPESLANVSSSTAASIGPPPPGPGTGPRPRPHALLSSHSQHQHQQQHQHDLVNTHAHAALALAAQAQAHAHAAQARSAVAGTSSSAAFVAALHAASVSTTAHPGHSHGSAHHIDALASMLTSSPHSKTQAPPYATTSSVEQLTHPPAFPHMATSRPPPPASSTTHNAALAALYEEHVRSGGMRYTHAPLVPDTKLLAALTSSNATQMLPSSPHLSGVDGTSNSSSGARRKNTPAACFHCIKAKARCDTQRPCGRCRKKGLTDCYDRTHGKGYQPRRHTAGAGGPAPKRKKVSVACVNCIITKSACDENRPCGRCVRLQKTNCRDRDTKRPRSSFIKSETSYSTNPSASSPEAAPHKTVSSPFTTSSRPRPTDGDRTRSVDQHAARARGDERRRCSGDRDTTIVKEEIDRISPPAHGSPVSSSLSYSSDFVRRRPSTSSATSRPPPAVVAPPPIIATRPTIAPGSALFMSPPTAPMSTSSTVPMAVVGVAPITASPIDVNVVSAAAVAAAAGNNNSRRRRASTLSTTSRMPQQSMMDERGAYGGDGRESQRPSSANSSPKQSPKRSAMSPTPNTGEVAALNGSESPMKRRKTSTVSHDESWVSHSSSSPRHESTRSFSLSNEGGGGPACGGSSGMPPTVSTFLNSSRPRSWPRRPPPHRNPGASPHAHKAFEQRGVFAVEVDENTATASSSSSSSSSMSSSSDSTDTVEQPPPGGDRAAAMLQRFAELSTTSSGAATATAAKTGDRDRDDDQDDDHPFRVREAFDTSNVLSDEEHDRLVQESAMKAMKTLKWRDHPSPTALPVAALCFSNASCARTVDQRKFLETVCATYGERYELSVDRHMGPATAIQSSTAYMPISMLIKLPIAIVRETIGPANHAALEWEYNFSDTLASVLGYTRGELTVRTKAGYGRLFHHDDWGQFVHRMYRVIHPPFSDSKTVRLRRKDGHYVRCLHIFNITNAKDSHMSSIVHMFLPM